MSVNDAVSLKPILKESYAGKGKNQKKARFQKLRNKLLNKQVKKEN